MSTPSTGGPLTATVTVAPTAGSRLLRIRPNRGQRDAPAVLSLGLTITPTVGTQVLFTTVGGKLVVTGGAS